MILSLIAMKPPTWSTNTRVLSANTCSPSGWLFLHVVGYCVFSQLVATCKLYRLLSKASNFVAYHLGEPGIY